MNRRAFLTSLVAGGATLASQNRPVHLHAQAMSGSDPMAAAEELSRLEAATYIPMLYEFYGYMHEDSATIVPRATIIGWYQNDFHPRGPQQAVATGVTWLSQWTWGVTGKVYTNVAEVSYTQRFNDGSVDYEKVRLVYHGNAWRYFFGRDRGWVDQQNHRFSLKDHTLQKGIAPYGLDTLVNLEPAILGRLPAEIYDAEFKTTYVMEPNSDLSTTHPHLVPQQKSRYRAHTPPSEFGLGSVQYGSIKASRSEADNLDAIAEVAQNLPPVVFEGWNTRPERGPAWLSSTHPAVDVVGPRYSLILVSDATYLEVSMFSMSSLEYVCTALAGVGSGR